MSFLAPWAMMLGVLGAAGAVLLHLVARHRPAAWMLPTARFIPDRQSLVSRAASRPRDLLLLALRVLLLLSAGAAFARPVFTATHGQRARVVLVDRSAVVADPADAWRRARELATGDVRALVIAFDSAARVVEAPSAEPAGSATVGAGSLTAGLIAARRAAATLARDADSVELVLLSPVAAHEIDAATWAVRAQWPGAIRVERLAARGAMRTGGGDSASLERAVPLSDVLGPALARMPVRATANAVRLRRSALADASDSAFARAGGTVVLWDSASAPLVAAGIALGDDVIVAPVGRRAIDVGGTVVARWADGSSAARDDALGAGCMRAVGIAVPVAGDLALRTGFQRLVRGLVTPCDAGASVALADSAAVARLAGSGGLAPGASLASVDRQPSRIVPWLLGLALACALLEPLVRRRRAADASVA
jgi:hypothetical protein